MNETKFIQTPEVATGKLELAAEQTTGLCPQSSSAGDAKMKVRGQLWDIDDLMRHVPLCRRSIHNLRKKGLPTIVLGRRLFWHPPSVEAWLLRNQRGDAS